jgi:copper chaperone NosL
MLLRPIVMVLLCLPFIAGCEQEALVEAPPPAPLTRDAVGYYCNMTVADHPGPKGQIHLKGASAPLWFSSARDTVAFTMLPGESKKIAAIYVHDAGKLADWQHPGDSAWIEARSAYYVIGSGMKGGMGLPETVPFADIEKANAFIAEHGGRVVPWVEIPTNYVIVTDDHHAGS